MDPNKCCLVLTSCINPPKGVHALVLNDAETRFRQYESALRFYIKNTKINNLVFCDNSNDQLDNALFEIAKESNKNVELLCFQGNVEKVLDKGKGYGEGEILEYAFHHSELIKKSKYIIKITGRLIISNLDNIVRLLYKDGNYINMFISNNEKYFADTRFFIMKTTDYRNYFLKEYMNVDDRSGQILEICFARKIYQDKIQYRYFPVCINFKGISGSTGKVYNMPVRIRIVNSILLYLKYLTGFDNKIQSINKLHEGIEYDTAVWEDRLKSYTNKRVAIYGAGKVGQYLYKLCRKHCKVILWVDRDCLRIGRILGKKVVSPQKLKNKKLDCIIVAVKSEDLSNQISNDIRGMSVKTKIEIFNG